MPHATQTTIFCLLLGTRRILFLGGIKMRAHAMSAKIVAALMKRPRNIESPKFKVKAKQRMKVMPHITKKPAIAKTVKTNIFTVSLTVKFLSVISVSVISVSLLSLAFCSLSAPPLGLGGDTPPE